MWWSDVEGTIGSQPNVRAPRCLPCNHSTAGTLHCTHPLRSCLPLMTPPQPCFDAFPKAFPPALSPSRATQTPFSPAPFMAPLSCITGPPPAPLLTSPVLHPKPHATMFCQQDYHPNNISNIHKCYRRCCLYMFAVFIACCQGTYHYHHHQQPLPTHICSHAVQTLEFVHLHLGFVHLQHLQQVGFSNSMLSPLHP